MSCYFQTTKKPYTPRYLSSSEEKYKPIRYPPGTKDTGDSGGNRGGWSSEKGKGNKGQSRPGWERPRMPPTPPSPSTWPSSPDYHNSRDPPPRDDYDGRKGGGYGHEDKHSDESPTAWPGKATWVGNDGEDKAGSAGDDNMGGSPEPPQRSDQTPSSNHCYSCETWPKEGRWSKEQNKPPPSEERDMPPMYRPPANKGGHGWPSYDPRPIPESPAPRPPPPPPPSSNNGGGWGSSPGGDKGYRPPPRIPESPPGWSSGNKGGSYPPPPRPTESSGWSSSGNKGGYPPPPRPPPQSSWGSPNKGDQDQYGPPRPPDKGYLPPRRDRPMERPDRLPPGGGWGNNKGGPTTTTLSPFHVNFDNYDFMKHVKVPDTYHHEDYPPGYKDYQNPVRWDREDDDKPDRPGVYRLTPFGPPPGYVPKPRSSELKSKEGGENSAIKEEDEATEPPPETTTIPTTTTTLEYETDPSEYQLPPSDENFGKGGKGKHNKGRGKPRPKSKPKDSAAVNDVDSEQNRSESDNDRLRRRQSGGQNLHFDEHGFAYFPPDASKKRSVKKPSILNTKDIYDKFDYDEAGTKWQPAEPKYRSRQDNSIGTLWKTGSNVDQPRHGNEDTSESDSSWTYGGSFDTIFLNFQTNLI